MPARLSQEMAWTFFLGALLCAYISYGCAMAGYEAVIRNPGWIDKLLCAFLGFSFSVIFGWLAREALRIVARE